MIEYSEYDIKNAERLRIRFKILNLINICRNKQYHYFNYGFNTHYHTIRIVLSELKKLLKKYDESEVENIEIKILKISRIIKNCKNY